MCVGRAVSSLSEGKVLVPIMNMSLQETRLPAGTCLGQAYILPSSSSIDVMEIEEGYGCVVLAAGSDKRDPKG